MVVIAFILYGGVLWAAAVFWTARDIRQRHRSWGVQLAATVLVLVFWVPGLIVYRIVRPSTTLADRQVRSLEAESVLMELSLRSTCPNCSRRVNDDFLVCPACRARLKEACASCRRPLNYAWVACPRCGRDRQPVPIAAAVTAASRVAAVAENDPLPHMTPAAPVLVAVTDTPGEPAGTLREQHRATSRPPSRDPFAASRERLKAPASQPSLNAGA